MKTREHLLREANGNKIHICSHYYSSGLTLALCHSILWSSASSLCSLLTWNIGGVWDDQKNFCLGNQRNSFLWNSQMWTNLFCLGFFQEIWKLHARFLNFFCSTPHVCNLFVWAPLTSNFHFLPSFFLVCCPPVLGWFIVNFQLSLK